MDLAVEAPRLRPLMFSIAYRMLGSVTEAEDVVQSGMVRIQERLRSGDPIDRPDAFASTVVTRLSIDVLRSARRAREVYVGPWLPEPLLAADDDPARRVEHDETLSIALLRMLERLAPVERAVFVLRESLGLEFDEIAAIVEKEPAAVRQILHRARQRVSADGVRFDVDRDEATRVISDFVARLRAGDVEGLVRVLSDDVVMVADGGGRVPAIQHPVTGALRVARFLAGLTRRTTPLGVGFEEVVANGQPAVRFHTAEGEILGVLSLHVQDGLVRALATQVNPDKLRHLGAVGDADALLHAGSAAAADS